MNPSIRAKKSLGQNFLRSESALNKIIEVGNISEGDFVLEIGPGQGALTEKLLTAGAKVFAIEKDPDMTRILEEKFSQEINSGRLILKRCDVLKFDTTSLTENYKLIANIPYYITGEIIRKFLSEIVAENQPRQMVLLVQKEVANRIIARDGKESLLSISVKAYCQPKIIATVRAGSFVPRPKVDSAIISFENISKKFFNNNNAPIKEDVFFKILRAGFSHKRKRLLSNFKTELMLKINEEDFIKRTGLQKNVRAEELQLNDWSKIIHYLI